MCGRACSRASAKPPVPSANPSGLEHARGRMRICDGSHVAARTAVQQLPSCAAQEVTFECVEVPTAFGLGCCAENSDVLPRFLNISMQPGSMKILNWNPFLPTSRTTQRQPDPNPGCPTAPTLLMLSRCLSCLAAAADAR